MMGVLMIGAAEAEQLKAAMERARQHPIPIGEIMKAAQATDQSTDRVTLDERKAAPPPRHVEQVLLPLGYRVALSFEEQPAGMCLHLSMSTTRPGMVPRPEAMGMVLEAIGVSVHQRYQGRVWIEEYEEDGKPGGLAVNIVVVIQPAAIGHA
jgi:hypothetical protein